MVNDNIVIDACGLINLDASGHLLDIISSLSVPVFVTNTVWKEEIKLLEQIEGETGRAINKNLITIVDFEGPELDNFINYAAELGDDGEAATFAVAINREWVVMTDDKSAIRFLNKVAPKIRIISTLELIGYWANHRNVSVQDVRQVLIRIRDKGHYIPAKGHPMYQWWLEVITIP